MEIKAKVILRICKARIVGQAGQVAPQPSVPTGNSPQDLLNLFGGQTEDPQASSANSVSGQLFRVFRQNVARSGEVFGSRAVQDELPFLAADIRQKCILPLRPVCVDGYPYRYPDGSCNNPNPNILRGASQTAQPRFVEAENFKEPEFVRKVASEFRGTGFGISEQFPKEINDRRKTLWPFLQEERRQRKRAFFRRDRLFIDGVEFFPPEKTDQQKSFLNFLNFFSDVHSPLKLFINMMNPSFEIHIAELSYQEENKIRKWKFEQFVDHDVIKTPATKIRAPLPNDGRLNASSDNLLPDGPPNDDCDDRFQEIPMLTVIHINFLREHNRIAEKLHKINPHWKDEKLFQEARKILTGIYQHIVYNEFIPLLVGKYTALGSNLLSTSTGHRNSYNRFIDPGTHNGFGVAAYRFGHSLVGRFTRALEPNFTEKSSNELRFDFFNNVKIRDSTIGPTRIGRWMADMVMRKRDKFISDQVRNHLFETKFTFPSDGFDLAAFNIQRGRDHGIPGYNKFREFCGLYAATMFNNGPMGFRDHDYDTVQKLESMYSHPDDVDLFVGGISEKPNLNGDILGPTFKCLIAQQFQRYKEGDRFFYENPFKDTGFTVKQLNDIKKQTFAGIFCRSLKLAVIQRKVFEKESYKNPRVTCDKVPEPNLYLWKERKGYLKH
ncbi:PXDN [Mytilus coruscus]|uniref:PXDN n=1 Tax=Mytilus coruscus TaxID=42192 RepID=A0A6J8BT04_MYTCO|nr:PXDN [Mytilus coruscus]